MMQLSKLQPKTVKTAEHSWQLTLFPCFPVLTWSDTVHGEFKGLHVTLQGCILMHVIQDAANKWQCDVFAFADARSQQKSHAGLDCLVTC